MSGKTRVISRKLISIIVTAMFLMTMIIAIVIGISGYENLESITRSNLARANQVITRQIDSLEANAEKALGIITQHPEIQELLILQSTLGPYYYEEGLKGSKIDEADQIYSLQSQFELAGLLKPIGVSHDLASIALYHRDTLAPSPPAFSMGITAESLKLSQYAKKDNESATSSKIEKENFLEYLALFDVSAIYELTLADFLVSTSAKKEATAPPPPGAEEGKVINRLLIINGTPVIQTTVLLNIPLVSPTDWTTQSTPAYIMVIEQQLNQEKISQLKALLNVDIALLIDNELVLETLPGDAKFEYAREDGVVNYEKQYFAASKKISYAAGMSDLSELEIVSLSPVDEVKNLNIQLFAQVFMVIISFTLILSILYYFLIASVINTPLSALMQGVEHLAQGELVHPINVKSNDEMGLLAQAFNNMSADVHEKNEQLKNSHDKLEELLEQQSKELESTQVQLIESEKMSSLGELVAGVSHEVSTPIGICITAQSFFIDETKAIRKKFDDGSMAKQDFVNYVETALDTGQILTANLNRTAELIKNFKQVAVDQCIEDLRPFVAYRYIIDLLTTLKPRIKSLKHSIEVVGDEQLVITSLPGAMAQIITNLIMNSIIHGFEDNDAGHIKISVTKAENGMELRYEDDGKGMSEESLEKVFDPFFTTRKGKGGTGLGMNIVYKLITDSLHGSIECKSEIGHGVCFDIFIADQELF
jgi:signal transduction histidine kinase